MSIHRWTDKDVVYIHSEKKDEIMPFAATWMDLKIINLSESEKDKYHVSLTYGILKYDIKQLIYKIRKRFIDIENKFMVTKGRGEWKR